MAAAIAVMQHPHAEDEDEDSDYFQRTSGDICMLLPVMLQCILNAETAAESCHVIRAGSCRINRMQLRMRCLSGSFLAFRLVQSCASSCTAG